MFNWEIREAESVELPWLAPFAQLSLGSRHGLGVTPEGTLYSFGDAGSGALGNGCTQEQTFFLPLEVPCPGKVIKARAGNGVSFTILQPA